MARPRRLECHAPVQLTVWTIRNLRRAAEVEIRVPRLADRPAAVTLLEVEKLLWSRGLLGFADLLGHVHPAAHLEFGFREARLMQRVLQTFEHRLAEAGYSPLGVIHERDELGCFERGDVVLNIGDRRNWSFCDQLQHEVLLVGELEGHDGILTDRVDRKRGPRPGGETRPNFQRVEP
jgi:hypothetical protein